MKIALVSSFVPFVNGGYRNIVEWLEPTLIAAGHDVERVYLPEVDAPELLFKQMAAFRLVDLSMADRVICFRPQAHLVRHAHKIVWFIHHLRSYYDLWDVPEYRGFEADLRHRGLRDALHAVDTQALREARRVFSNSQVVTDRLSRYNGIDSEVLYPPVLDPQRFRHEGYGDEIVCVCRLEHHKRQHLLVEALGLCRTPVRVRLCGLGSNERHADELRARAAEMGVAGRLTIEFEWITEARKEDLLARCLASAYLPLDEDSYGYPVLEAAHARKATLSVNDSGGVLEFVRDGVEGLVTAPEPAALAQAMDQLFEDRDLAARLGAAAQVRVETLRIGWPRVLEALLS